MTSQAFGMTSRQNVQAFFLPGLTKRRRFQRTPPPSGGCRRVQVRAVGLFNFVSHGFGAGTELPEGTSQSLASEGREAPLDAAVVNAS